MIQTILPTPMIVMGAHALAQLPEQLARLQVHRILIVTDPGIVKAGIYRKLTDRLSSSTEEVVCFDRVQADPELELARDIGQLVRGQDFEAVIGLGGGSSLDLAKIAAALATNLGDITEYMGIDRLDHGPLPLVCVPTTAGTGSEVTPIAILSDAAQKLKKGLVSPRIIPRVALLDPILTADLPAQVTAFTGMDALTHAIEAFTSKKATSYTDMLALRAVDLLSCNIGRVFREGRDLVARENMLFGSLLAGMAFANAGVAGVHALAYPLGGMFHIPHGLANSVLLADTMAYNLPACERKYQELGARLLSIPSDRATADMAVTAVRDLCRDLEIPRGLAELQIPEAAIDDMARSALLSTRLLVNNPREITVEGARQIYRSAY